MVKLFIEYISGESHCACKVISKGETFKDALLNFMDETDFIYFKNDIKEEENTEGITFSAQDVIDFLETNNWWSNDQIVLIKDERGKVYINNYEIEQW